MDSGDDAPMCSHMGHSQTQADGIFPWPNSHGHIEALPGESMQQQQDCLSAAEKAEAIFREVRW